MAPDDPLARIHRELTLFARRVRGDADRLHPDLSFVGYSVLAAVEEAPGARSADLVARFGLDKSTVSRQVGDLERRGLLERAGGRRGGGLHPTAAGLELLRRAAALQRASLAERLAGWEAGELRSFAGALERMNAPR